jgi:hypothetical protein
MVPKAVPIFEKLERALAAMRADQDAVGRAKKLLETYKVAVDKPIPAGLMRPY